VPLPAGRFLSRLENRHHARVDDLRVTEDLKILVDNHDPGGVVGLYLYGSAVIDGLRPDSDVDLLLLTQRSLRHDEREGLLQLLLNTSGRRALSTPGRPIELTSVALHDIVPWTYPPVCDFLYGEWLRDELGEGRVPERHVNPDLALLLTSLQQHSQVLTGIRPTEALQPVPAQDLRRSVKDSLGSLLDDLVGDERNVLLTLARMVVTLDTGQIVSKDEAARHVIPMLNPRGRSAMTLALRGYLGEVHDHWSDQRIALEETAAALAARIRAA
jgi:streptomycin 3"-adenylyltransferase